MSSQNRPTNSSPFTGQRAPSDSGSLEGISMRRSQGRRKRLACRRCQARKIKCDGSLPKCSACQRAGVDCVDGKTTWHGPSIPRREAIRLQEQNRRLLEIVRQRWPDVDLAAMEDGQLPSGNPHGTAEQIERTSSATPIPIPIPSPDITRVSNLSHTPETYITPYRESTGPPISGDIAHEIGMIPLSAGVNKYVGPSSGFSIAKLVLARADQATGYSQQGEDRPDETTAEARCRSAFMISPSALPTSKEQAIQLSQIYFEQVHPRYPFLHQQSHLRALNDLYNNPAATTKSVEFQVTMVLAISATILSRRLRIPFSGEGLCAAAMMHADDIDFQSSTEGVQCLLLISMFTLHSPFLGINPWYLNYQCLAAVLDLGLQQDISIGHPIDPFEREMRTRLFWVVFAIDRIIATTLGRPVGLRDEACDLRLPTYEDQELETLKGQTQHSTQAAPSSTGSPGAISCAVIHFKLALLNSEIMHTLHSVSPNAPEHTYPRIPDVEVWKDGLYDRLLTIRQDFPTFGEENKHLLGLCEIRYHEIVMLLFRPTPRIRAPSKDSLTRCYQSAEATIRLWKELYSSDRMSYSWTSIHSISLSAIIILYCIWMVQELAITTEIDSLTQTMMAASNLLSAAGEHWMDARRCRNSLNNLTVATVRWLANIRSSQLQSRLNAAGNFGQDSSYAQSTDTAGNVVDNEYPRQPQQAFSSESERMEMPPFNPEFPWVDTYINGEDLATLFKAPNPFTADPSLTMEGMFSDYQPMFDFYQGNEFGM